MRVHLVGSVGLSDAPSVFQNVADILGTSCPRIPDGETGERSGWVRWQAGHLGHNVQLEPLPGVTGIPGFTEGYGAERIFFRLRKGVNPEQLSFGALGYAQEALASWEKFDALQLAGRIPRSTRFQVSLPTPVGLACMFFLPDERAIAERAFAAAIEREVQALQNAIPGDRLAIQWDAVFEVIGTDTGHGLYYDPALEGSADRMLSLCALVAPTVELGIHLCYGDSGGKHIREPSDLSTAVRLTAELQRQSAHPIAFVHMPVPLGRSDDAYFAPLSSADFTGSMRLVLGLVHDADGLEGCRGRIAAARRHVSDFDIATECGFGRRDPSTIGALLSLHRDLCAPHLPDEARPIL